MGDHAKAVDARNRAYVMGLGIDKGGGSGGSVTGQPE